ncbi:hypothetical protein BX600DRAFT_509050 [Xylariales sp. PMI_506]|nr:hypothetical protein BX600DRAFT_509050 [Xylariales sp. PMI_506]
MANAATDFDKIISAGRERKRNEALAARIFSKDNRRASAPPTRPGTGPSLASRVGVKKPRASSAARVPAGNINGEWTHDLHNSNSTPNLRSRAAAQNQKHPKPDSLAARIQAPAPSGPRAQRRAKLADALTRASEAQVNVTPAAPKGITIRGLAGPFAVMAQNFAPGTTAADIESAVTPIGGVVSSCRLVKTYPIVIAEIVFENRDGAERVIETFNNQTADGRLLHVYHKPGGFTPAQPAARPQRTNEVRPGGNSVLVDGRNGFDEPMEAAESGRGKGGLYSDQMVPKNNSGNGNGNRRGRGFQNRQR